MRKKAIGLGYDKENDRAPKVIAKGEGELAEKILEIAREHEIFIKEDQTLLELLFKLELEDEIPEELYEIVAEVFMYIYNLENEEKEKTV